jgi:hypothetical protein
MQRDIETVIAQDDQDFLSKLQILFNKSATPSALKTVRNLLL